VDATIESRSDKFVHGELTRRIIGCAFLKLRVGLLLNFNVPTLRQGMRRFIR